MSLKKVNSTLLTQIGFSEDEQTVYFTILGIGSASLGEIYLQTGLPLEDIQAIIQDLFGRGYLKRIEGKINRYIAVEPFLKGFLFVEKEFQNDVIGIENSLISVFDSSFEALGARIKEFKASLPPIYTKVTEELRDSNEKLKMDLSDSIYRHSDKIADLSEQFDLMLTEGFDKINLTLGNELNNLEGKIGTILNEEQKDAEARIQKFEDLTNNTIHEALLPLTSAIEEYDKIIPKEVDSILKENKAEIAALQKSLESIVKETLSELNEAIKEFDKEVTATISNASKGYSDVIKTYKTATHELIESEKPNIDKAVDELVRSIGASINELSTEATNLKENITALAKTGLLKKPDPDLVKEATKRADKIDALSQKIKQNYDAVLKVYQENILNGIAALMEKNDKMLADQLKEGKATLKDAKEKLGKKWRAVAKEYNKSIKDAVKTVLKDSNDKVSETASSALKIVKKSMEDMKKAISETIAPFRDVIYADIQDALENLFLDSSKRLRLYSEINNKTMDSIKTINDDSKFSFKSTVQEILSKPKNIATDMVTEYTGSLDVFLTKLDRDQTATLDAVSAASEKFLSSLQETFSTSQNQISNRLAGLIYKVNETKTYLQEITNSVDEIVPVPRAHSLIIYGNKNSMNALHDLLLRTKSSCTIVVPTVDADLADILIKRISKTVRIRVLADLDPFRDEALIASLKEQGNISLRQYTLRDFYAVFRDGAEVLLAPVTRDEELTTFLTEQDALVRATQNIINASFMAHSKEVK